MIVSDRELADWLILDGATMPMKLARRAAEQTVTRITGWSHARLAADDEVKMLVLQLAAHLIEHRGDDVTASPPPILKALAVLSLDADPPLPAA